MWYYLNYYIYPFKVQIKNEINKALSLKIKAYIRFVEKGKLIADRITSRFICYLRLFKLNKGQKEIVTVFGRIGS